MNDRGSGGAASGLPHYLLRACCPLNRQAGLAVGLTSVIGCSVAADVRLGTRRESHRQAFKTEVVACCQPGGVCRRSAMGRGSWRRLCGTVHRVEIAGGAWADTGSGGHKDPRSGLQAALRAHPGRGTRSCRLVVRQGTR